MLTSVYYIYLTNIDEIITSYTFINHGYNIELPLYVIVGGNRQYRRYSIYNYISNYTVLRQTTDNHKELCVSNVPVSFLQDMSECRY